MPEIYMEYFDFDQWVEAFSQNGFKVELFIDKDNGTRSAIVEGKNITGAFADRGCWYDKYMGHRFCADNKDAFNKWQQCPLVVNLPFDWNELMKHLKVLGSKVGHDHSNTFEFYDAPIFPYQLEERDDL